MRLLLDENCPERLARMLRREEQAISVTRIQQWREGGFTGRPDAEILAAAAEGLTLFTFDVSTIPAVLTEMAVAGQSHGGVVFASCKRTPHRDYASFAHALARLWHAEKDASWTDRVVFLSLDPESRP